MGKTSISAKLKVNQVLTILNESVEITG